MIFLLYTLLTITLVFMNRVYQGKKDQIHKFSNAIQKIQYLIISDLHQVDNFLIHDTKNENFYKTGKSQYLYNHQIFLDSINEELRKIWDMEEVEKFDISNLTGLIQGISTYDKHIQNLAKILLERGFKDYGIVGEMRDEIHALEAIPFLDLSDILMFRRHEKDYIIRNEKQYIDKLNNLYHAYRKEIANNTHALTKLDSYVYLFNKMVKLDKKIGLKRNTGLKYEIEKSERIISAMVNNLMLETRKKQDYVFAQMKTSYILLTTAIILLTIFISYYLSYKISKRLRKLSKNISDFIQNGFSINVDMEIDSSRDEIGHLIVDYETLKQEIISHIRFFEEKVEQRTREITMQKMRIEQQKEEIMAQRDELLDKNNMILYQNKSILSSINYAKGIQEVLLPEQKYISSLFDDYFILYKPRDIISGDFYWFSTVQNEEYNLRIIALVDCTGHGVPGALMSMLGIAFLNEIINRKEVRKASHILDHLRENVIQYLKQNREDSRHKDGMDIAICLIDDNNQQLQFSGANRPLIFVRDGEINKILGDNMPIGKYQKENRDFTNHVLDLEADDRIYLYSDGYVDQFGGKCGSKFKARKFKDLIHQNWKLPFFDQHAILEKAFYEWKGDFEQTDDVTVIGFKPILKMPLENINKSFQHKLISQ